MPDESDQPIPEYVAHTPPKGTHNWQSMRDHTHNVTELASSFARLFGAADIALWCGLLHDVGKYSPAFQQYLRDCYDADRIGAPAPPPGSAEHKTAGAAIALTDPRNPIMRIIAGCILGHHGGLPAAGAMKGLIENRADDKNIDFAIDIARKESPELSRHLPNPESIPALAAIGRDPARAAWDGEMLMRLVFSCLVDADSLDTERHFQPEREREREFAPLSKYAVSWLRKVEDEVGRLQATAPEGGVKQVRADVFKACIAEGKRTPGLFSLTVPTGGGKTLSSLAFGLQHAISQERSRIIYALPYTSIIDQTARVFRKTLGEHSVVEHHSAMDWRVDEEGQTAAAEQSETSWDQKAKLAADNWNAPLIVTTTVQLFESLFSNKTSRCRKLHNLAGSVIILDEVQTLPPHLLQPLVSGLGALLRVCNATIVLCTATQPAIAGQSPLLTDLPKPIPIIPDPAPHFAKLSRVSYRVERAEWDWNQVAAEMADSSGSCMTVLNTKNDALSLLDALEGAGGYVRHLSTLLCGAHRKRVLDEVRELLSREAASPEERVLLVATQVIEAGVDIDFPRLLRAKGPLDRLIQAAGRCNREGRRPKELSEVVVFDPAEGSSPPGDYQRAISVAWNRLTGPGGPPDLDAPDVATAYFAKLYGYVDLDREGVQKARGAGDFPEVAKKVKLIVEDTVPVLVPYCRPKHGASPLDEESFTRLVETIRGDGLSRALWAEIQPFTVAVRHTDVERMQHDTLVELLIQDQLYLWSAPYDPLTGIGKAVGRAPEDLMA